MSTIRGVKFVSIPVTEQDRALAFYTEKLGFRVVTDQPFDGKQRWIELGIPGADTRVVLFNMGESLKPGAMTNNVLDRRRGRHRATAEEQRRGVRHGAEAVRLGSDVDFQER